MLDLNLFTFSLCFLLFLLHAQNRTPPSATSLAPSGTATASPIGSTPSIASHEFTTRSLKHFISKTVGRKISNCPLPFLSRACDEGRVVNLQEVLQRFTFDRDVYGREKVSEKGFSGKSETWAPLDACRSMNGVISC
ncbi:hypothetical protein NL676_002777 [Syzygium grande]|nr:hypothetical protein NL676_002777 [Syzygium grande]